MLVNLHCFSVTIYGASTMHQACVRSWSESSEQGTDYHQHPIHFHVTLLTKGCDAWDFILSSVLQGWQVKYNQSIEMCDCH